MSETIASPSSPKRLALFLDGTWNTVQDNTSVWRLKSLCRTDGDQLVYYSQGVGTQFGERIRGGIFGYGLDQEVIEAYQWLIQNYNENDKIYLFGFSRGAYTARSLSGFISRCGLLQPGAPMAVAELYDLYRRKKITSSIRELKRKTETRKIDQFELHERWMLEYSAPVPILFIGVWDTVGALGIPFGNLPMLSRSAYQFLDTDLHINNAFGYHALAIDEHRFAFTPTLWTRSIPVGSKPPDVYPPRSLDHVEQRWFVGAHANVGGGYRSDILPQVPLQWLLRQASRHGLKFRMDVEIDGDENKAKITDSFGQFAYGLYRVAKLGKLYYRPIGKEPIVENGMETSTINETVDGSVFDRWRQDPSYRPSNLETWAKAQGVDPAALRGPVRADAVTVPVVDPPSLQTPQQTVPAPMPPPVD